MGKRRTAIDANVLIAAWSGREMLFQRALEVLEDPDRLMIVSDALWHEVMPKAIYFAKPAEENFYRSVFARAEQLAWSQELVELAKRLAQGYGLAAMDAVHLAVAVASGADEFVSGERPGKPMFRVREVHVSSLWQMDG